MPLCTRAFPSASPSPFSLWVVCVHASYGALGRFLSRFAPPPAWHLAQRAAEVLLAGCAGFSLMEEVAVLALRQVELLRVHLSAPPSPQPPGIFG